MPYVSDMITALKQRGTTCRATQPQLQDALRRVFLELLTDKLLVTIDVDRHHADRYQLYCCATLDLSKDEAQLIASILRIEIKEGCL